MNERFKLTCAISSVPLITVCTAAAVWSLGIIAHSSFVTIMGVVAALVYILKKQIKTNLRISYFFWGGGGGDEKF